MQLIYQGIIQDDIKQNNILNASLMYVIQPFDPVSCCQQHTTATVTRECQTMQYAIDPIMQQRLENSNMQQQHYITQMCWIITNTHTPVTMATLGTDITSTMYSYYSA